MKLFSSTPTPTPTHQYRPAIPPPVTPLLLDIFYRRDVEKAREIQYENIHIHTELRSDGHDDDKREYNFDSISMNRDFF